MMLEICPRCHNEYDIIWVTEGNDYNDFGQRWCPFCGLCSDDKEDFKKEE